jgi:hypothetical protein
MINPSVSPQVNNLSAETRNFKTREQGIYGDIGKTQQCNPSLTRSDVWHFQARRVDKSNAGGVSHR